MANIIFDNDSKPTIEPATLLSRRYWLAERRPIDEISRFQVISDNTNLTVSAWNGSKLITNARCLNNFVLSNFVYITYLTDLAVDEGYQIRYW